MKSCSRLRTLRTRGRGRRQKHVVKETQVARISAAMQLYSTMSVLDSVAIYPAPVAALAAVSADPTPGSAPRFAHHTATQGSAPCSSEAPHPKLVGSSLWVSARAALRLILTSSGSRCFNEHGAGKAVVV